MNEEAKIKSKWTTRRKVLTSLAILICIPTLVIAPGLFWELHLANSCFRAFNDALVAKQYERAYDLTSPEFRASTDYPPFLKIHNDLTLRMGGLKKVDVIGSNIQEHSDGWFGTVDADMIFDRGTLHFTFVLKKANSGWRIYNYREQ
ncbi:MAG TPA: hypothetical protein VN776_09435 [Terracidiphilus sp.]|nr:hypothetical protein [Terracidiphilus sp.]